MNKYFTFICILFYVAPVHSISSYIANYELYIKTNLGVMKVGSAEYELVVTDNVYVFKNNAKTEKELKANNKVIQLGCSDLEKSNNLGYKPANEAIDMYCKGQ